MFDDFIEKLSKTIKYRKNQVTIREQEILNIIYKQKKMCSDEIAYCQNNKSCVDNISKDNQLFIEKAIEILINSNAMTNAIHLQLII